jgi:ATP-dependent DNA helicase RecG
VIEHPRVPPRAFASTDELDPETLAAAPVRWPRPSRLEDEVDWKPAPAAAAAETLGLETVGALLEHLPRDTGEARTIGALQLDETATVLVEVRGISSRPVRRRGMKPLVEATVTDGTGVMKATFFNQPWLANQYKPGTRLMLAGKYQGRNRFRVSTHARTEEVAAVGDAVAEYPATKGITSTQIMAQVRAHRAAIGDVVEPLPAAIRVADRLPSRPDALASAHFGDREGGRRRLAFDELLLDQIVQLRLRRERRGAQAAAALRDAPTLSRQWQDELLPFTPTNDQRTAMAEVDADLAEERPMARLLMGEVGSGKTVVAVHAMLRAVEHGMQAALMAPTETLAEQHFATLQALMPGSLVPAALLTGSTPAGRRNELLGNLGSGALPLIVGTHALIEDTVVFDRLAVAVVDEQHRFGVRQRAALDAKAPAGLAPHVLHMTATPIPRTLRLASFGALDVTALRELPKGRRPIVTHLVSTEHERDRAYERIREELRAGRQAFVVCPLVAESEALQARAASAEYERLKATEFSDFDVVLLPRPDAPAREGGGDGGVRGGRRRRARRDDRRSRSASTSRTRRSCSSRTPSATGSRSCTSSAGASGRGEHESLCLLFGPKDSARLQALEAYRDGFKLAEIDLELRGEGELTGTRQSGLARFRFARLPEDADVLERAHARAARLLDEDPALAAPELALLADALAEAEAKAVAAG